MNKETREGFVVAFGMLFVLMGLGMTILAIMFCNVKARLRELEIKESQDMSIIHNRLTNTANNLQSDINNCLDWTEDTSAKVSELRSIIKNTNGALTRTNKKLNEKSTESTTEVIPNSSLNDVEMTEIVATAEDSAPVSESADTGEMQYLGSWEVSAYEWSDQPCANGNWPTVWYTCAFNYAPRNATLYVEGLGYFVNEDYCGTDSRLDIFLGDYDACIQFGTQYHDVYLVN